MVPLANTSNNMCKVVQVLVWQYLTIPTMINGEFDLHVYQCTYFQLQDMFKQPLIAYGAMGLSKKWYH